MKNRKFGFLATVIALLIVISIVFTGCSPSQTVTVTRTTTVQGSGSTQTVTQTVTVTETPGSPAMIDLAIMQIQFNYSGDFIEVGEIFGIDVVISNEGQIVSNPCDFEINNYPGGSAANSYQVALWTLPAIAPGGEYTVVKNNMQQNSAGEYELFLRIWNDSEDANIFNNFEWEHLWVR